MAGPVIAARLMDWMRPESIFLATALAHFALAGYTMLRVRVRAPVPIGERDAFTTQPSERAVTPAVLMLDPRAEAGEGTAAEDAASIGEEAERSS